MNQENWQKAKHIFNEALKLPSNERTGYLEKVCSDNQQLGEQVKSLLESYESDFLEETAVHKVAEIIGGSGLKVGQQIARYKVKETLGTGGMGEVFLAEDTELKRPVAIKILHAEVAEDKERISRFIQEARAASALNHPNILTIHEISKFENSRFIVSEYVKGETLRDKLKQGNLSLTESLEIAAQIAAALEAAHEAGIVHRDIKPENIMLRNDGLVKVLDFGLAKLTEIETVAADSEASTLAEVRTNPGVVMGTVAYMSPEQARGQAVDARTDIWSLGVVLYEMLSGKLPFPGDTTSDIIASILKTEVEPLENLKKEIPRELESIYFKALAKDANERYQTTQEFLQDLRQAKKHLERADEQPKVKHFNYADERNTELIRYRPTLSAEYVFSQAKYHKRSLGFSVLGMLILILAAIGYKTYLASNSKPITSVAVLPFENASGNQDLEYLSDGLSDNLIDRLSLLPQLKVISRNSSFKYKGKEVNLQNVANTLGVQAIVTGRVVQKGDNFIVHAELTDAANKTQLWGEQYTRKTTDIQILQEEIARTVSEKLRLRLSGEETQKITKEPTQNPEAYQLFLLARHFAYKGTNEDLRKSINYLIQAVELDPNFALAYRKLAQSYEELANNGGMDPKEAIPKAKAVRLKALGLDKNSDEAHLLLGELKESEWDWKGAENEYRQVIELNPSRGHWNLAFILSITGRHDEALAEINKYNEISPLDIFGKFLEGNILNNARRYDEAIKVFKEIIELDSNFSHAHWHIAYSYEFKGMYSEAITEYQKYIEIQKEKSARASIGVVLAKSGRRDEAMKILNEFKSSKDYVSPAGLAILYSELGDKEGALKLLERAYDEHDIQLIYINVDAHYDSLRNEPRFQDIVRKVGLPPIS